MVNHGDRKRTYCVGNANILKLKNVEVIRVNAIFFTGV